MSTAIVVNALIDGTRWTERIGGADPVGELSKKLRSLLGPGGGLYAVIHEKDSARVVPLLGGFTPILVRSTGARELFRTLSKALSGHEEALYLFADTPLLDTNVARELLRLHREECAEYTYGEGFPAGTAPEVIQTSIFAKLASLLEKDDLPVDRGSLFHALSKEINSFDIETSFAPENLKLKRIELATESKRNGLLVERVVAEKGFSPGYGELCDLFRGKPGILRTVPAYVEIEITNRTNSPCLHSPLTRLARETGDIHLPHFYGLVEKLRELSGDLTLSLSYLGEPLLHPGIREILGHLAGQKEVRVIVETDGLLLFPPFADYLRELGPEGPTVIVGLDAVRDETYGRIRGGELKKAERNVRYLLGRGPAKVYVQMVRMDVNEGEMLRFFDLWEKEGAKPIIQKYNSFCGLLPDLSHYDLTPLDRFPCWHLQRDLVVLRDGRVARCKQDVNGERSLGSLFDEDAAEVWARGSVDYLRHCEGLYDEQCGLCDEYFTFNF